MKIDRYYKPELDVLRLFAFLFVFFVHRLDLAPIDKNQYYWGHYLSLIGNYGVPLFFFLSAFLITELLMKEENLFGKINIKLFYIRRILRIWPLYFTFFFGMVVLTSNTSYFGIKIPWEEQLAFSLFSGNWYITFNQWQSYCINPLWSVSVEEQFYILLPLLLYFTGKRGLRIFSFLAIIIAYVVIIYYALEPTDKFNGQWTNSFVQFQFFAAGILLSIFLKGWQPNWHIAVRIIVFILGISCWLFALIICEVNADAPHLATIKQSVTGWCFILFGVVCMFLALYGTPSKYLPPVLVYLGRISYGMYIFHITMFWIIYKIFPAELENFSAKLGMVAWKNNIGFVIAFIMTLTISILSYGYFEKRFLKLKTKFTRIPSRD